MQETETVDTTQRQQAKNGAVLAAFDSALVALKSAERLVEVERTEEAGSEAVAIATQELNEAIAASTELDGGLSIKAVAALTRNAIAASTELDGGLSTKVVAALTRNAIAESEAEEMMVE